MESGVHWQVEGNRAELSCGALRGSVVVEEKSAGFAVERWDGRKVDGVNVLAYLGPDDASRSLLLADTYVRGGDFVATFAESGDDRVAPQLYWRASVLKEFGAVQLELIISVRTEMLDSQPQSHALTVFNADAIALHTSSLDAPDFFAQECAPVRVGEILKWRPAIEFAPSESTHQLFVFRLRELGLSFAQIVHPSDFVAAELSADFQLSYCLSTTLFPERLEKGVIRRGRICGWFLPMENDFETAVKLARAFVEEPLPLTA